jgi:CheY-like chemotaxis protein
MSAEMLRELGCSAIEAGGAREAIRIIEGGARPVLLFTNLVMPECEACWTMCSPGQPGKNGGKGQRAPGAD